MINRTTDIDLSNYVENGEWQLLSITVTRNVVYYACCSVGYVVVIRLHVRHHHCTVSITDMRTSAAGDCASYTWLS